MPRIGAAKATHEEARDSGQVQAVALALSILEVLAQERRPVGVTRLAQLLDTSKSRIHRHLRTLMRQGYVAQSGDGDKYRVGPGLVGLCRALIHDAEFLDTAREVLQELRDALGHFAVVSRLEAKGVRVLFSVAGKAAIEIGVRQGTLLESHTTAQGKVALAFGPDALRARALAQPLPGRAPETLISPADLAEEIARIRRCGWAAAANQAVIGLNALAAPVFDVAGSLFGTVAIVDSVQFIPAEPREEQIAKVLAAARRLSAVLGWTEAPPAGAGS